MRKTKNFAPWAVFFLCWAILAGCSGPVCENKVISGVPSPDAAAIAFVFLRSCDAAPAVTTQVSVVAFHDALRNEKGNVLAVDGEQPAKVAWRGPTTLLVTGFKNPTYQHAEQINGITVEFH